MKRMALVCDTLLALMAAASMVTSTARASEVSLVSGVYQKHDTEVQNDNKTSKTELEVGGRFMNPIDPGFSWLIESRVSSIKYDAPSGQADQPDDNSIAVGGGVRWYFDKISEKVRPYFQGRFGLRNESFSDTPVVTAATATAAATTTSTKHDKTSLFYASDIGLYMDVSKSLFFTFEMPLFESSIYGLDKTTLGDGATKQQTKTTHLELYAKSYGGLNSTIVGVGMKF